MQEMIIMLSESNNNRKTSVFEVNESNSFLFYSIKVYSLWIARVLFIELVNIRTEHKQP